MDEGPLRAQVAQAAQQMWLRGLIVGDDGLISVEVHRRRYLVTPPRVRRGSLRPEDLIVVDVGGTEQTGSRSIPADQWLAHRLAYQALREGPPTNNGHETKGKAELPPIHAAVLVTPPMTLALARLSPCIDSLPLTGWPAIPTVAANDEAALKEALEHHAALLVPPLGLFVTGPDLAGVLNLIEAVEHAATIELACRRGG